MTEAINHVGLKVSDYGRAKDFYIAALGTLGIKLLSEFEFDGKHYAGFGVDHPVFWIDDGAAARPGTHVAFNAASHAAVGAFYSAGLSAGGRDNGPPGIRAHYSANYYAAFVFDPDGHNIEAVCLAAG
ncbi:MAG: VOC family protein [Devosia sp.]|nr:VOC family protein [Devosia sp.]